ncbi:MAG: thermonuclease family protein [Methyloceanibacter sp.]|uniref:thermonuclease family protein n=1 Tax=Methyloceanibacter sp. TaxID=1965321 RepID=UPI003D6D305F
MSFASRIVTAVLGLAVVLLFWPIGMPVGFQQAWWAREQVIGPVEPPPPDTRLFTKPPTPPPAPAAAPGEVVGPKQTHAVPAPEPKSKAAPDAPAEAKADAAQTAAINKTDEAAVTPPVKPKLHYRVVVRDGGTLELNGVVIKLGGIVARDADAKCMDKTGRSWACGAQARTALTRLIRGRAVSCDPPASSKAKSITARCTVGGTDLSIWMVAQGWAVPSETTQAQLNEAAGAARKKRLGLWR